MDNELIDKIYGSVDFLMKNECWILLNHIFSDVSKMYERYRKFKLLIDDFDKDFIITLLTTTLPHKTSIAYRDDLYYEATFIFDKETLKGLK